MDEIHAKLKNGESVLPSELPPNPTNLIDYLLKHKAQLYGENILTKIFSRLNENDPDIVWLSYVKESVCCWKSIDPQPIHQYISRTILKDKYNIDDAKAADILARTLLEHCCEMINFKAFQHPAFDKLPIDISDFHENLKREKGQMLQIDVDFIDYLKKIGAKGIKLTSEVQKNSTELIEEKYKNHEPLKIHILLSDMLLPE